MAFQHAVAAPSQQVARVTADRWREGLLLGGQHPARDGFRATARSRDRARTTAGRGVFLRGHLCGRQKFRIAQGPRLPCARPPGAVRPTLAVAGLSSASGGPFRGSRSLRGRARSLEAVTAINVGVGDAHGAPFIRPGTGVPLPRLRCPARPRGGWIDIGIDIGLCIRRHHPDG
jgi:hypothetical protein